MHPVLLTYKSLNVKLQCRVYYNVQLFPLSICMTVITLIIKGYAFKKLRTEWQKPDITLQGLSCTCNHACTCSLRDIKQKCSLAYGNDNNNGYLI